MHTYCCCCCWWEKRNKIISKDTSLYYVRYFSAFYPCSMFITRRNLDNHDSIVPFLTLLPKDNERVFCIGHSTILQYVKIPSPKWVKRKLMIDTCPLCWRLSFINNAGRFKYCVQFEELLRTNIICFAN